MSAEIPLITVGTELQEDFIIGEMIGGGYFGRIYEAYQKSLDRKVAIKFERYSENWQNDAVVLSKIDANRHLPQVYTKFELWGEDGRHYVCLVMEYIEGRSLDRLIKDLAPDEWITPDRIVKWMTQLCDALDELHGKSILHTDVKPGNIMITDRDDVKLIDFNTAVINQRIGVWGLCTSKGYSPPEQYETEIVEGTKQHRDALRMFGSGGDDAGAQPAKWLPGVAAETNDLYAAGATLYFLLFKRRPESSEKRHSKEFIRERSGRIKAYAPFYQIIEKATALKPANRYQSAKELSSAVVKADKRARFWTTRVKVVTTACVLLGVIALTALSYGAFSLWNQGRVLEAGAFDLYEQGNRLLDEGDFAGAMAIVTDHWDEYADTDAQIFLYTLKAETLCGEGNYEQFLTDFNAYPDEIRFYQGKHMHFYAELLYWTGEAYFYMGEYEKAADGYQSALAADEAQFEYKKALLRTLAVLGQADAVSRMTAELSPEESAQIGDDWLYFFEGIAQKAAQQYDAAETAFLRATASRDDKLLWSAVYTCSAMLYENGDYEKVIAFLQDKQSLFPAVSMRALISERLGNSFRKLGRLDEAIEQYRILVDARPYVYSAYELLASVQDESQRYEEEMETLDRMIALSPQNIRAYLLYVNALLQIEYSKPHEERAYVKAYEMFLQAEAIEANDPEVVTYRDSFANLKLSGFLEDAR